MDTKIDRLRGLLWIVKQIDYLGLSQAQIMDLGDRYQRNHLTWQSSTWYVPCIHGSTILHFSLQCFIFVD
jgi:hypothetical protein